MRHFIFSDKISHKNFQNVATCVALRDFSIWNITEVNYFPKKLMQFYEAKISAADWALLDREPRAPAVCLYQNQPELSWEANDVD